MPLTGTTDAGHMRADLEVFDFRLEPEEVERIERHGPAVTTRSGLPHQADFEETESMESCPGKDSERISPSRNPRSAGRHEGRSVSGVGHVGLAQGRADLMDGLKSCLGPLRQALPAEGGDTFGQAGTEAGGRDDRRGADDLGEDVREPAADDGRPTGQEREQDRPDAVDVRAAIDRPPAADACSGAMNGAVPSTSAAQGVSSARNVRGRSPSPVTSRPRRAADSPA